MRTPALTALTLAWSCACGVDVRAPDRPPPPACQASEETFVLRALDFVQGRAPAGAHETRVWATAIRILDADGRDGRREVARSLARGERYGRRWSTFLSEHLGAARHGPRVARNCWVVRTGAGDGPELATFVRTHDPGASFGVSFSMWDLTRSAIAADDISSVFMADAVTRMLIPIEGANVSPTDLEWARRQNFGQAFESNVLGRRRSCLGCHNATVSATDAASPEEDRFWPLADDLERQVFGAPQGLGEEALYAPFRWSGFVVEEGLLPWGTDLCGTFSASGPDVLGHEGHLAGPLPAGATTLDVARRLAEGFTALEEGRAPDETPTGALAYLVSAHLADEVWREASGHPLTLAHGVPRTRTQMELLRSLTATFVDGGQSLQDLVVEVITHPLLDRAVPAECRSGPDDDVRLLDPFAGTPEDPRGLRVRRRSPWIAMDRASDALGWAAPERFPAPYALSDPELYAGIGVYLEESRPGQRGLDLPTLLRWESRFGSAEDPAFVGDPPALDDWIGDLVEAARTVPDTRLEAVMVAVKDRVLGEPDLTDPTERELVAALVEHPLSTPVAALTEPEVEQAARRLAGALLQTPQALLAGAEVAPVGEPPTLTVPGTGPLAICERVREVLPSGPAWTCSADGALGVGS